MTKKPQRLQIRLDPVVDSDIIDFLEQERKQLKSPQTKIIKGILRRVINGQLVERNNDIDQKEQPKQELNSKTTNTLTSKQKAQVFNTHNIKQV